MHACFYAFM